MTGNQTSHITVTLEAIGSTITETYAVNEGVLRELNQLPQKPTGAALSRWLINKGCRYDSLDGPAYVSRNAAGVVTFEEYFRDGRKHREDGPAVIWYNTDGSIRYAGNEGGLIVPEPPAPPKAPDKPSAPGPS